MPADATARIAAIAIGTCASAHHAYADDGGDEVGDAKRAPLAGHHFVSGR